jgi:hypothetical protein
MTKHKPHGRIGGRDSTNGQFIPLPETKRRPDTTQREVIPLPGYGDSKPKPKAPKQ